MTMGDDATMPTNPISPPLDTGASALARVVDSGLLRCGVPPRLGGGVGGLDRLVAGAAELARHHPAAAWLLWAQRMAIEALLQSPNIALRDHWLPDFLCGECAATLSPWFQPLLAHDTGRGWLLQGEIAAVPNLQWAGFSLAAPVHLGEQRGHWVLLRSEENGLSIIPGTAAHWPDAQAASLGIRNVFFREDEWIGGPELPERLAPVAIALARCLPHPTDWNQITSPPPSPITLPTT